MKEIVAFGAISLVLCWAISATAAVELVYNCPPNTNNIDNKVVTFINGATTSLDVAIFQLDLQKVVDALVAAKARGVTVRVVCEANNWNASFDQLVAAGIPVIRDTDGGTGSALMHDKYIVRDGTAVLTGSYNWTATQTTADKNTVIIVTNAAELAGLYQQDFTQMFVYKRFGNQKQAVSSTTCQVDGYSVEVYFSPKTRPEPALVSAIGTANSNLYFSVFTFTSTPVADAIAARDSAGVSCRGVFDNWQASGAYSRDEALRAAGVEVRADTWSGFLHDKIMAIDGATTSDPIGVVGSYNWTASANSSNDENVLIMHYPAVANSIRANVINTYNKYAR